ncbi:MAG: hypothetical protein ACLFVX_11095 [Archaeoglobaceae archaeon]
MKGYKDLTTYLWWAAKTYLSLLLKKLASKHSKKLLMLVASSVLLASCSVLQPVKWEPPEVCNQPETESLILEHIPNPMHASLVLELANLEILTKSDLYTPDDVRRFLDSVETLVEKPITWKSLFDYVTETAEGVNKVMGDEIILLSSYFEILNQDELISECDRALVKGHLQRQRDLLEQVTSTK